MSSQKAYQTLIGKEFRQNIVIFVLPFLVAMIVFILIQKDNHLIGESLALKLAIAIPVAIALAYGVQSFDLEEKGQTRDFLIVKPLSVSQIIWIKYMTGLITSLLGGLIWLCVLAPKIIEWPSLPDLKGFLFVAVILLELIVYSLSFLFGVLIKGPVKIIGAVIGGSIAVVVFFIFWFELIKFLTWNNMQGLWSYLLLFALTVSDIMLLYQIIKRLTALNLQNQVFATQKRPIILCFAVYLMLSLIALGINAINPPVIIPYSPLSTLINGDKGVFLAYHGAKCPDKNFFAVADYSGRLGLVEPGKIPVPVYQSPIKPQNPLKDISWAPDGSKISFKDQKTIRVLSMPDKKIIANFTGDYAMWSRNSQQVLIGTIVGNSMIKTPAGIARQNTIQLTLADFKLKTLSNMGQLKSIGLAFDWDSTGQRILALDGYWRLIIIDVKNNSVQYRDLPKKGDEKPGIFLARITPPLRNKSQYLFQVFSTNQKHGFNIDLYGFNSMNNSIVHQSSFKNVAYSDFIAASSVNKALYSTVPGVYRNIELSKAVE